jgi:hypothetical protein
MDKHALQIACVEEWLIDKITTGSTPEDEVIAHDGSTAWCATCEYACRSTLHSDLVLHSASPGDESRPTNQINALEAPA